MLSSITHEIPGKFNEDWIPTRNICLRKGIREVNTLALQTYNKLKNQHQHICVPLYHWRIQVQGFRRLSLLDIPYHTISCLQFTDIPIKFPLALEDHVTVSTL